MLNNFFFTTAIFSLLLSGCSISPPLKQLPTTTLSTNSSFISNDLPNNIQKGAGTNIEGTYFSVMGASGSVAVGLLLGPIGVAANVAHVNSVNRERATPLNNLTSLNLAKILNQEVSTLQIEKSRPSTAYKIIPAANLYFKSDKTYLVNCNITVELINNGTRSWGARYSIPVEGIFDSSNINDTNKAMNSLAPCLHSAYEVFNEHIQGKLDKFEKKTITNHKVDNTGTVTQTLPIAVSKLPEKILVNDTWGITELRRSEVISIQ